MSFPLTFLLYKFRFIAELFLNDYEISFLAEIVLEVKIVRPCAKFCIFLFFLVLPFCFCNVLHVPFGTKTQTEKAQNCSWPIIVINFRVLSCKYVTHHRVARSLQILFSIHKILDNKFWFMSIISPQCIEFPLSI